MKLDKLMAVEADVPPAQVRCEDLLEMIFTSGTTAKPKAVMLTHANALRSGERTVKSIGLDSADRCLTALPLFHVNAQSLSVLGALTVGATLIVLEEFSAGRYWSQIRQHAATYTSLVAMQVRTLLAQPAATTDSDHHVRRLFFAINVPDSEKDTFEKRFGVQLINGYGLSEAMTLVSVAPVFGPQRWPSIGLPAFDRTVRVVDADGNDVPTGTLGEIIVSGVPGRTLMKGYFKDPDATHQALRDGWLYTGDNGYVDQEGYLYFFDRKKDVIKRAGENISASEVEAVLVQHPAIAEAAVIGVPDPIRDEAVKAFVVCAKGEQLLLDDIRRFCAERLAPFKIPTEIEILDELPKTSIGKVEKKLLRARSAPL
jgi:crotonobetaine/carnitine-CoA ligase